jgi:hypothetical protein
MVSQAGRDSGMYHVHVVGFGHLAETVYDNAREMGKKDKKQLWNPYISSMGLSKVTD